MTVLSINMISCELSRTAYPVGPNMSPPLLLLLLFILPYLMPLQVPPAYTVVMVHNYKMWGVKASQVNHHLR